MSGREAADLFVSELFGPTIQGEGALIGQPSVFVRLGGCDYRCSWCDSLHAVDSRFRAQWRPMTTDTVWREIEALSGGVPLLVSLSGGNPAIQPLAPLIARGRERGYRFALETQGSVARDWFAGLDWLVLSPKPPSSGMTVDWAAFDASIEAAGSGPRTVLKIPVLDAPDYRFARDVAARYPQLPVYLQPVNHTPAVADAEAVPDRAGIDARWRWLAEQVLADRWFEACVLPQLHVLMWGNRRGV